MLSDEQMRALQRHADGYRRAYLAHTDFEFDLLVKHVDSLLAQARADALEEAAKICESMPHTKLRGQHMSDGTISLPATPGQCAGAIRARKDGQ